MIKAAIDHGANEILLHRSIATRSAVRLAIEADLPVVVWTVDDPKWIGRARRAGIYALITNDPATMLVSEPRAVARGAVFETPRATARRF